MPTGIISISKITIALNSQSPASAQQLKNEGQGIEN